MSKPNAFNRPLNGLGLVLFGTIGAVAFGSTLMERQAQRADAEPADTSWSPAAQRYLEMDRRVIKACQAAGFTRESFECRKARRDVRTTVTGSR